MDCSKVVNLPAAFFDKAASIGDAPFLWAKAKGTYQPWSWSKVDSQVRAFASALTHLGLEKGARVLLVSENRPEWFIADFAIMACGGITVPAYITNTQEDHEYILKDCGAEIAIVSTEDLAKPLARAAARTNSCRRLIVMEALQTPLPEAPDELHQWKTLLEQHQNATDFPEDTLKQIQRDDTACFIYTSGTGGAPKGVMLSHGNILANCTGAYDLLAEFGLGQERFLSFLPLSHSYEHTVGQIFAMTIGAEIYYAEAVGTLLANLSESRPTVMMAVPRLYEMLYQRINRRLEKEGEFRKYLFRQAERLGRKKYHSGGRLPLWERPLDLLVERTVRKRMRERFGGCLKGMVSGGAALNTEIGLFFHALGLPVLQGYGQTESSPVVSVNRPHRIKMDTVGPPLKGVEVETAEDGEILVRGELVMQGYWNRPEETQETIRQGWLHTGDIGSIDQDGYIHVTDRKKDIIVLSGGDNISPARIETLLDLQPEISQSMVYGDKQTHLVALIVPDMERLKARKSGQEEPEQDAIENAVRQAVDRMNKNLSVIEKVRRFTTTTTPFSVENDMLTPTMKIRRHVIRDHYQASLEALY